jgi:hypothetical protein
MEGERNEARAQLDALKAEQRSGLEETVKMYAERAAFTAKQRNALRAEVERLREAHRQIATCPCAVNPHGADCGECVTCIARSALKEELL